MDYSDNMPDCAYPLQWDHNYGQCMCVDEFMGMSYYPDADGMCMDMMVSDDFSEVDIEGTECMGFNVQIGVVSGFWPDEGTWSIEETECAGSLNDSPYVECCIPNESYFNVICEDSYPDAWNGGSLTIDGQSYCGESNWGAQTSASVYFHYGMATADDTSSYYYEDSSYNSYEPSSDDYDYSSEDYYYSDYPVSADVEELMQTIDDHETRISELEQTIGYLASTMTSFNNFMSCAADIPTSDNYSYDHDDMTWEDDSYDTWTSYNTWTL